MASINGIKLKSIKTFKGHEQEDLIQGNVYYKNKKVGFYSQDSWGGCDNIQLDSNLSKTLINEINDILKDYKHDTLFGGISDLYDKKYNVVSNALDLKGGEYLFSDLIQLMEYEKIYKIYSKLWNTGNIAICYKNLFKQVIKGSILPKDLFKTYLDSDKDIQLYYIYSSNKDFDIDTNKLGEENEIL